MWIPERARQPDDELVGALALREEMERHFARVPQDSATTRPLVQLLRSFRCWSGKWSGGRMEGAADEGAECFATSGPSTSAATPPHEEERERPGSDG